MGKINQHEIGYMKERYEVTEDKLIKHTPIAIDGISDGVCKVETVITKEMFIECYRKWILQENGK